MNSIIALVYLSVAVILIVFGVKQIKNRKNLRKINQKQEDEVVFKSSCIISFLNISL